MPSRRRQADDDIFRVHSRYLGPPGFTLPVSVPYRGILPGLAAGFGTLVLLSVLGLGPWRFLIALALGIAVGALAWPLQRQRPARLGPAGRLHARVGCAPPRRPPATARGAESPPGCRSRQARSPPHTEDERP